MTTRCCNCNEYIDYEVGVNPLDDQSWCDVCYFYEMRHRGVPVFVFPSGRVINIWTGDPENKPKPCQHGSFA